MNKRVVIALAFAGVAVIVFGVVSFASALKMQHEMLDTNDEEFLLPVDPYQGSLIDALR